MATARVRPWTGEHNVSHDNFMKLEILLLLMVLPPLAGAAINGILGRRFSRAVVSIVGCGASGLSMVFAILAARAYSGSADQPAPFVHKFFTWIQAGQLTADYSFFYDRLTLIMTLTVTVVAFLIHLYSRGYMEHEGGYYRFFTYLNLFLFMMLTLVTASSYPLMFVGWEGVGLCSYLLIGFYFTRKAASDAGKKAFIVTRIGDAGFTVGVALLFWTFHSLDFQTVFQRVAALPQGELVGVLTAAGLLLFLGAAGKSAQLPLYVWLPDAMEGPTPVSALIHAATMVTAGVYLVARSSIIFAHAPSALAVVGIVGCLTAFFAGTIALTQNDLKRMLAYSTISQLGYMFLGCGVGVFAAGIFHLMTHAFFKSLLFLAAGSVMHAMNGELDMRRMGGLRHKLKITHATFLIGTIAISGIPLIGAGFFSKDEILAGAYEGPLGRPLLFWLGTFTAALTAFYMFRGLYLTFYGTSRVEPEAEHHLHESSYKMTIPLMVLAFFSVVAGWVSWPKAWHGSEAFDRYLEPVFAPATDALSRVPRAHFAELSPGVLMGFSILAALIGIGIASWWYLKSTDIPEQLAERFADMYRVLIHKYYVDEFYNWLIVRPLRVVSEKFLWRVVDAGAIDNMGANGLGESTAGVGNVLRRIQSGNISSYATWVMLGAVLWLLYIFAAHA
jgi:NADH-quinone oxidoreductase subunit L